MSISAGVLLMGGYVLAHACYSVSDLEEGDLLIPFVVTETSESRKVTRFEAETQEQAIDSAKISLLKLQKEVDIYGFAREGTMKHESDKSIDVISVDVWEKGLEHTITIIQPFQPNNGQGQFQLSRGMIVVIDGQEIENQELLDTIKEGIRYHPVGDQFNDWIE